MCALSALSSTVWETQEANLVKSEFLELFRQRSVRLAELEKEARERTPGGAPSKLIFCDCLNTDAGLTALECARSSLC